MSPQVLTFNRVPGDHQETHHTCRRHLEKHDSPRQSKDLFWMCQRRRRLKVTSAWPTTTCSSTAPEPRLKAERKPAIDWQSGYLSPSVLPASSLESFDSAHHADQHNHSVAHSVLPFSNHLPKAAESRFLSSLKKNQLFVDFGQLISGCSVKAALDALGSTRFPP